MTEPPASSEAPTARGDRDADASPRRVSADPAGNRVVRRAFSADRARTLLARARGRFGRHAMRRRWRLNVIKTRVGIELLRNWRIDRRYGGSCSGSAQSRFSETGAYGTSSADYWQLRRIFSQVNQLRIETDDVLVDVGCGKGRVLNHWLELGHGNRIVGIELDPAIAAGARERLASWRNVEVLTGDAVELLPRDATIIFLFNPFDAAVLARLRDRIADLYPAGGRLRVVYYFSMHRDVFDADPRFEVRPLVRRAFHPGVIVTLSR